MKDEWVESRCVECDALIGYLPKEYAAQRWRCPAHAAPDEDGFHEGQAQYVDGGDD